jgi:hypothetical protein
MYFKIKALASIQIFNVVKHTKGEYQGVGKLDL